MKKRLISLLLAISVLASGCGKENVKPVDKGTFVDQATANSMKAVNFKGDAKINNQEMDSDECPYNLIAENELKTADESYVRVDLGATKHLTMDVNSLAKVSQEKKHYKIQLEEGEVFFVTTEPLSQDEEMEFVDSIAQFAIHGTTGCFRKVNEHESIVIILEGEVQGTVGANNTPFTVKTGELADLTVDDRDDGHVTIRPIVDSDIDMYMKNEIGQSVEFSEKLIAGGGTPIDEYEKTLAIADQDETYQTLLKAYYASIQYGFVTSELKEMMEDGELDYFYNIVSSGALSLDNFSYAYYDINGDGINELLITDGMNNDDYKAVGICDIWTISQEGLTHVKSPENDLCSLYAFENGQIANVFHSDANQEWNLYLFSSSSELFKVDKLEKKAVEDENPAAGFVYTRGIEQTPISGDEEFKKIIEDAKPLGDSIGWKSMSEINRNTSQGNLSQEDSWKNIYAQYINDENMNLRDCSGYAFINLNGDEIPELVFEGNTTAALLTVNNGTVIKVGNRSEFYKEAREKTYYNENARKIYAFDEGWIWEYQLINSKFSAGVLGLEQYDGESDKNFYEWESQSVDKNTYNDNVEKLKENSKPIDWKDISEFY